MKKLLKLLLLLITTTYSYSQTSTTSKPTSNLIYQNVYSDRIRVGGTGTAIDPSAVGEYNSTTKGLLIPRMTNSQMLTIQNPRNGLIIYNIDNQCLYVRSASDWINVCANLTNAQINWNSITSKPTVITNIQSELDGKVNITGNSTISGNITASNFIKNGGLSTQFLMADGSSKTGLSTSDIPSLSSIYATVTTPTFITNITTPRNIISGAGDIGNGGALVMGGNNNDLTVHGTGKVILGTGGFQRLVVTNAGNVGIGTTAPTSKFEISGTDGFRYNDANQADGKFLKSNSTGVAKWNYIQQSDVSGLSSELNNKKQLITSVSDLQAFSGSVADFDGSTWDKITESDHGKTSDGGSFAGTIIVVSSSVYWKRKFEGDILVEWFGAKADGATDCTPAFQNAVNVRQFNTPYGWNRNVTGKGNGVYLVGNIIFPADGTITLKGSGLYAMYLKLKNGENKPMVTVPAGDCVPYFENLVMDGNKANQSDTTSHGIEYKDAIDSTYRRAGMITNVNIINFKGDGVHGGRYKQLLRITNTDVRSCDGHGLYQPRFNADWFINSGDFGNNGKCNLYISSQVQVINASIYFAGDYNIYFGGHTRWSSVIGNIIDHADKHGIMISSSNTNPCEINIMGNRFYDNSLSADNVYSDIYAENANGVNINHNSFIAVPGQNTGHVKYLVELVNSTKTNFFNNTWRPDSFITGITNDVSLFGNQDNSTFLGDTRINGNMRSTKNLSFTETIVGTTTGSVLGVNKIVFGSGDQSQTLGAGKIGRSTSNQQLQIDYGSEGVVFRNNGNVVGFFMDPLQRMFINTTTTIPSAQLAVVSTNRGFLPPVMTATNASLISSPAEGLMLYVTDTNGTFTAKGWWGYDGAAWQKLNN